MNHKSAGEVKILSSSIHHYHPIFIGASTVFAILLFFVHEFEIDEMLTSR